MAAKIRIKCERCGTVENVHSANTICPSCRSQIADPCEGKIYIYRQGSPYGVAGGFGLFLNNQPYGFIGNKELLCFPIKYGSYRIHCAVGMSRKCQDIVVNLSENNPVAYTKVYIKPGFWANSFVVEPVDPKLLDL